MSDKPTTPVSKLDMDQQVLDDYLIRASRPAKEHRFVVEDKDDEDMCLSCDGAGEDRYGEPCSFCDSKGYRAATCFFCGEEDCCMTGKCIQDTCYGCGEVLGECTCVWESYLCTCCGGQGSDERRRDCGCCQGTGFNESGRDFVQKSRAEK